MKFLPVFKVNGDFKPVERARTAEKLRQGDLSSGAVLFEIEPFGAFSRHNFLKFLLTHQKKRF